MFSLDPLEAVQFMSFGRVYATAGKRKAMRISLGIFSLLKFRDSAHKAHLTGREIQPDLVRVRISAAGP